ncbi:hypothetical protein [Alkalihalobacillus sp. LMS39]|uniref:hypothetical protein n=1 Tax=Alkalihalobacillus sp. LMS39 TaxID=2924032 RepID=UPI001FB5465C|nr:hypothetical protein [Alkalihalobacillus sp. LMS39]UOE95760.1 hypothetical protein MM271_09220 [Alkalihalobacillus sp. LMS39]
MKKVGTFIFILIVSIGLFGSGYMTGKLTSHEPTREVFVGYDHPEYEGRIDYATIITDVDDQWTIDNLQQIMMFSRQTEDDLNLADKPNVHLVINSPKANIGLVHSEVWFHEDGAVIKMAEGDYRLINRLDAEMLKKMIDYT